MISIYKMLIGNNLVDSSDNNYFESTNPYNEEIWAKFPNASSSDIENAFNSANQAFLTTWRETEGFKKNIHLNLLADLLEDNLESLARLETQDNGKILSETKSQILFAARQYRYFAGYTDKLLSNVIPLDNQNLFDYTLIEPYGVVSLIISWNSPLYSLANKLAPALATGNTVVIKPSEFASTSILEFGKLISNSDFPKGVINIISGDGSVGEKMVDNPIVRKVSFTGGVSTGKLIGEIASRNLIPATLELGGKSPNIIFEDADIDRAVTGAIAGIFGASGQSCVAGSRLFVQNSIFDTVVEKIVSKVNNIRIGNPLEDDTQMGPISNKKQFNHINNLIETGIVEGAQIINENLLKSSTKLNGGYFISPTIFVDVNNNMKIAQEEFFGPVLCILKFRDEDEVIKLANDSKFGLASGIWTNDLKRAHRVSRKIEAGTVWINTYRTTAVQAPFGGYKSSGYGKERGHLAIQEYIKIKNVMIDLSECERDPFSMKN